MTGERPDLSRSARRVQDALAGLGFAMKVTELPQSTRSATQAAQAVGCQVGQIAKSIVFSRETSGEAILVMVSGSNRVDQAKLSVEVGEPVVISSAEDVRRLTGFAIGGIPPVGHITPLPTYIDEDLLSYNEIWAAAGTPNAVFRLAPTDLVRMTAGRVIKIH